MRTGVVALGPEAGPRGVCGWRGCRLDRFKTPVARRYSNSRSAPPRPPADVPLAYLPGQAGPGGYRTGLSYLILYAGKFPVELIFKDPSTISVDTPSK